MESLPRSKSAQNIDSDDDNDGYQMYDFDFNAQRLESVKYVLPSNLQQNFGMNISTLTKSTQGNDLNASQIVIENQ